MLRKCHFYHINPITERHSFKGTDMFGPKLEQICLIQVGVYKSKTREHTCNIHVPKCGR